MRTPLSKCPSCATELDTTMGDDTPEEGNYSICGHCAAILQFDANLSLHALSKLELLSVDPRLLEAQEAVRQTHAELRKQSH